jgi:murein DD-endopeptidase MepM/ murein hydrolase activator NlpD
MAKEKRRIGLVLIIICILIVLGGLAWFGAILFEGESPSIALDPIPEFISKPTQFKVTMNDRLRGLRLIRVVINQEGREIPLLDSTFPGSGILSRKSTRQSEATFTVDPPALKLAQGRVELTVQVWDYSMRRGGDGNLSIIAHKMLVDTIPPSVHALSPLNYVNMGGTGLVVYQASPDTLESGVKVGERLFPGYPADEGGKENHYVCYFGLNPDETPDTKVFLWARDKAGNEARAGFNIHIRQKRFQDERIEITDRFLGKILPYFSSYPLPSESSEIDKFLWINRELRRNNTETFFSLRGRTSPKRLWEGVWLGQANAAKMSGFGEQRQYYYKGQKVDEQTHLGVDLASLAQSPIQAANRGRVIHADQLGIYGLTVILDHGQGLASVYAHLNRIDVSLDQEVKKGDVVGISGQTGLAGGDHLHFSVMVGGVFVNPIEWWDEHWIQDNITRKLALLNP